MPEMRVLWLLESRWLGVAVSKLKHKLKFVYVSQTCLISIRQEGVFLQTSKGLLNKVRKLFVQI